MAQKVKNLPAMQETQETWVQSLGREDPLENDLTTCSSPVSLPEKSHGQRSLVGYNLWGCKELNITERLRTHTHTDPHPCFTQVCLVHNL